MNELTIRTIEWKDIEWARQLRNHPETNKWLASSSTITFWQQIRWFYNLKKDKSRTRLVLLYKDIRIGLFRVDQIDRQNKNLCIGLDIEPDWRGKGLAQKAYKMLIKYYFSKGMNRLWLLVGAYNNRAIYLYEKLGFLHEGTHRQALYKDGTFHDYFLMGILKEEYNG